MNKKMRSIGPKTRTTTHKKKKNPDEWTK